MISTFSLSFLTTLPNLTVIYLLSKLRGFSLISHLTSINGGMALLPLHPRHLPLSHHHPHPPRLSLRKMLTAPPGPRSPFTTLWRSPFEFESFVRGLFQKYGPVISVKVFTRSAIFIGDRTSAYQALIQQGATFGDRPASNPAARIMNSGQKDISSAKYGPVWRVLRRNLTAEILHPARVQMYAPARKWMLSILIDRLKAQMEKEGSAVAVESFQFAMFCLLVFMCFGDKLDEAKIRDIKDVQKQAMLLFNKLQVLSRKRSN